jgi:hypothetical protein
MSSPHGIPWLPNHVADPELLKLGEPEAAYAPSRLEMFANYFLVASLTFSGLLPLGGGMLLIAADRLHPAYLLIAGIGVTLLAVAAYWLSATRKLARQRVLLFADSLVKVEADGFMVAPWKDIESVRQRVVELHIVNLFSTTKAETFYRFTIRCRDGQEIRIKKGVGKIDDFLERLRAKCDQHAIPIV